MKRFIAACITLGVVQLSGAALPPDARNSIDLDTMISHLRSDYAMMSTVQEIDVVNHTISYGRRGQFCIAIFARKPSTLAPGMVGPRPELEFKESQCFGSD